MTDTTPTPTATTPGWEPSKLMRALAAGEHPYGGGPFDSDHIMLFKGDAAALLAEYDRLRGIEERARKVRDGIATNGAPWQQNAESARYILGEPQR